jgi:hypothetical protein
MADEQDQAAATGSTGAAPNRTLLLVVAWLWVVAPFLYGLWQTVLGAQRLFQK